jgi:hypothetical protein
MTASPFAGPFLDGLNDITPPGHAASPRLRKANDRRKIAAMKQ